MLPKEQNSEYHRNNNMRYTSACNATTIIDGKRVVSGVLEMSIEIDSRPVSTTGMTRAGGRLLVVFELRQDLSTVINDN